MARPEAEDVSAVLSAHVAKALSDRDGVPLAEDLAGPTVSARMQASGLDQLGRLVVPHPDRGRRHPHPDLHGAPAAAA